MQLKRAFGSLRLSEGSGPGKCLGRAFGMRA